MEFKFFIRLPPQRPHWGGGGGGWGLAVSPPQTLNIFIFLFQISRIPTIFSIDIPYPYGYFLQISRIPVTPNGASPQGSAMLFYITIYKLEQKSGERTRYAANCLSSKLFIANLAILYIQIALTFKLAKLKRYPPVTNTN